MEATSQKTAAIRPPTTHLKDHPNQMNMTCGTLLEEQGRTHKRRSLMPPFSQTCKCRTTNWKLSTTALYGHMMWPGRLAGSDGWKETDGERKLGKSVPAAWHYDDDIYKIYWRWFGFLGFMAYQPL